MRTPSYQLATTGPEVLQTFITNSHSGTSSRTHEITLLTAPTPRANISLHHETTSVSNRSSQDFFHCTFSFRIPAWPPTKPQVTLEPRSQCHQNWASSISGWLCDTILTRILTCQRKQPRNFSRSLQPMRPSWHTWKCLVVVDWAFLTPLAASKKCLRGPRGRGSRMSVYSSWFNILTMQQVSVYWSSECTFSAHLRDIRGLTGVWWPGVSTLSSQYFVFVWFIYVFANQKEACILWWQMPNPTSTFSDVSCIL